MRQIVLALFSSTVLLFGSFMFACSQFLSYLDWSDGYNQSFPNSSGLLFDNLDGIAPGSIWLFVILIGFVLWGITLIIEYKMKKSND